jgi:hypothetical protein
MARPPLSGDRAIAALARRQRGVFTTTQAIELGLTPGEVRHRGQTGRWIRVIPGVHTVAGTTYDWYTNVMVACLATGGAASHRTAAVLHDVIDFKQGKPEVTVVRSRRVRLDLARVHQSTDLDRTHITRVDGIPTTTPMRLAMDLGAVVPFTVYERSVDDLIARKLLKWEDMPEALCRLSRRGRPGLGPARKLVTARYGDDVPESLLERAFLALVRGAGLPDPEAQVEIADAAGFIARADFAYPDQRVAIELDGRRHHLHADAFERDRAKRNRLQLLGWQVLAYTWDQVIRSGPTVVGQLALAVA